MNAARAPNRRAAIGSYLTIVRVIRCDLSLAAEPLPEPARAYTGRHASAGAGVPRTGSTGRRSDLSRLRRSPVPDR